MFKSTKQVIIPVFQLVENVPVVVTFKGPFYLGEKVEKDKDPATLAQVLNPATNELGLIVANEILKTTIVKEYPNNSYVGKTFQITKLPKREGKNYNGFRLEEGIYTPEKPVASPAESSVGADATKDSTVPGAASPEPASAGKTGKK